MILLALAAAATHPAPNSRAAALASIRTEFRETDANRDGVLTRAEVGRRLTRLKASNASHDLNAQQVKMLTDLWFARSDANHDGRITLKESEATMAAVFDRYDLNHDGLVTPQERAAAVSARSASPQRPEPGR